LAAKNGSKIRCRFSFGIAWPYGWHCMHSGSELMAVLKAGTPALAIPLPSLVIPTHIDHRSPTEEVVRVRPPHG
jgi:hypothetical protein